MTVFLARSTIPGPIRIKMELNGRCAELAHEMSGSVLLHGNNLVPRAPKPVDACRQGVHSKGST